jgi:hypothetical protein
LESAIQTKQRELDYVQRKVEGDKDKPAFDWRKMWSLYEPSLKLASQQEGFPIGKYPKTLEELQTLIRLGERPYTMDTETQATESVGSGVMVGNLPDKTSPAGIIQTIASKYNARVQEAREELKLATTPTYDATAGDEFLTTVNEKVKELASSGSMVVDHMLQTQITTEKVAKDLKASSYSGDYKRFPVADKYYITDGVSPTGAPIVVFVPAIIPKDGGTQGEAIPFKQYPITTGQPGEIGKHVAAYGRELIKRGELERGVHYLAAATVLPKVARMKLYQTDEPVQYRTIGNLQVQIRPVDLRGQRGFQVWDNSEGVFKQAGATVLNLNDLSSLLYQIDSAIDSQIAEKPE